MILSNLEFDGWTWFSCHFVVLFLFGDAVTCKNMSSSSVHFSKAEWQWVWIERFPPVSNCCFSLWLNLLTSVVPLSLFIHPSSPSSPAHLVSEYTFWKKSTLTHLHAECLGSSCERRIEMEMGMREKADYAPQMHAQPPGWPTSWVEGVGGWIMGVKETELNSNKVKGEDMSGERWKSK